MKQLTLWCQTSCCLVLSLKWNLSDARLLSLKYCAHLDNCNFFGNCMTYGRQEDAFCSCIVPFLDHTCTDKSSQNSTALPTAAALTADAANSFSILYLVVTAILLSVVILVIVLYILGCQRRKKPRRKTDSPHISLALKSVDDYRMSLRNLLIFFFVLHLAVVSAAPAHSMTRIQEVFRSLIPPENDIRGKKYFSEPLWLTSDDSW